MKRLAIPALGMLLLCAPAWGQYWVQPMVQVRQLYQDTDGPTQGTISRFGDSISVSKAYFCPLEWSISNTTPQSQAAVDWIHGWMRSDCWDWQDDGVYYLHGCEGGTTSSWPLGSATGWPGAVGGERKVDYWLRNDNPEIAVIMWGTNDLSSGLTPAQYKANLLQVVLACKANGTIPLLTTAPPRHNYDNGTVGNQQRAADFAQAVRDLAVEELVPLIEYHDECTTRNPHDPPNSTWDGADPMWSAYSGYEVPTSISRDGVHPSNYSAGRSNFSEYGLDVNGFNLRNYMTLMGCQEVHDLAIVPEPATLSLLALGGCLALLRRPMARRRGRSTFTMAFSGRWRTRPD
jgi:hypothetical protein